MKAEEKFPIIAAILKDYQENIAGIKYMSAEDVKFYEARAHQVRELLQFWDDHQFKMPTV